MQGSTLQASVAVVVAVVGLRFVAIAEAAAAEAATTDGVAEAAVVVVSSSAFAAPAIASCATKDLPREMAQTLHLQRSVDSPARQAAWKA